MPRAEVLQSRQDAVPTILSLVVYDQSEYGGPLQGEASELVR